MQRSKQAIAHKSLFPILAAALAVSSACTPQGPGTGDTDDLMLTLTLGETKQLATATVDAQGATVRVDSADSALNGLTINIPEGAFDEDVSFTISESEILDHDFGSNLSPAAPLITIDNGDIEANEILTVRIPVEVPEETHVMAFYYDRETGDLEGISELEHDSESITIMVNHFCDILLNRVAWKLILNPFDSKFEVKQDNWRFTNHGSYLSPGGICSGMSATALYYYTEKKGKEGFADLYDSYDADDDRDTPSLEIDDAIAIKAASTAQYFESNFRNQMYEYWYELGKEKDDFWAFLMFAHAIMLTGEPQYVSMFPETGNVGHAMIVYKKVGNALYVADPNEPTVTDNKIEIDYSRGEFGEFTGYESQWNAGSDKIDFTKFFYVGKWAVVPKEDLKEIWDKVGDKTVGSEFPDYTLKVVDKTSGAETALTEGYTTTESTVYVKIDPQGNFTSYIWAYNTAGMMVGGATTGNVPLLLSEGDNVYGFHVEAEVVSPLDSKLIHTWTDFKYVTIRREASTTPPTPTAPTATITSPSNGDTFDVGDSVRFAGSAIDSAGSALSGSRLQWTSSVDGPVGYDTSCTNDNLSAGQHTITLTVTDRNDLVGTATVGITVIEHEETPEEALANGSWRAEWTNNATGNDSSGALSFDSDGTVTRGDMWTSSHGTWTLNGLQVTIIFANDYVTSTWTGSINAELNLMTGTYSDTQGSGGPWEAIRNEP